MWIELLLGIIMDLTSLLQASDTGEGMGHA
jgi:hypothetical protein